MAHLQFKLHGNQKEGCGSALSRSRSARRRFSKDKAPSDDAATLVTTTTTTIIASRVDNSPDVVGTALITSQLDFSAMKIQRAIRCFLAVKNTVDPITLEKINTGTSVLIVEPSGTSAFRFNSRVLMSNFIMSARFVHPITGRELLVPEVRRIGMRAGGSAIGALLAAVFDFRDVVVNHKMQKDSLVTYLADEMRNFLLEAFQSADKLDEAVLHLDEEAERRFEDRIAEIIEDYSIIAERVAETDPEACSDILAADWEFFTQRVKGPLSIDNMSFGERIVFTELKDAEDEIRYSLRTIKPKTAVGNWLNDIWK